VVERRPEKAGVASSILAPGTIVFLRYTDHSLPCRLNSYVGSNLPESLRITPSLCERASAGMVVAPTKSRAFTCTSWSAPAGPVSSCRTTAAMSGNSHVLRKEKASTQSAGWTLLALVARHLSKILGQDLFCDRWHGDPHDFTQANRWRTESNVRNVQVAIRSERHRRREK
jgi:hypothetical protein